MFTIAILSFIILWLFYKYWVSNYKYWEDKGIPSIPGRFPFGSEANLTLLRKFQGDMFLEMFRKFPSSPYFGLYFMRKPTLVIKDPEYVQVVLVKEFSSFRDRLLVKIPESDVLSQHLLNLEGDKWKALRSKLSPTFTSGRMKAMFPLFLKSSEAFDSLLESHVNSVIDVKDLASRYTTDILCSCAFGLDTNVMEDKDSELIQLGKNIFSVNLRLVLAFIITTTFPKLSEIFQFRCTPEKKESQLFVYNLVKETVKQREENNIKRKDFLDLLMQLKNKGSLDGEEEETEANVSHFVMDMERLAAQCFVFFVAGYETASTVQSFCLYELALNPPIQERVQTEIDRMEQLHAGVTYDAVKEMTYLDMVVSETMRKYPTVVNMSRMCTKTVTMPNGDTIEKGQFIFIPIWALHRSPENFPDPDKFDPERFSEENKHNINPYAYIPFGEGPRFCIGKRFGLLQTKMGLISILRKYSVEPCEVTQIPLKMSGEVPLTKTVEPIQLKLVKRKLS